MKYLFKKFPNQKLPRKVIRTANHYYFLDKGEKILDFTSGWTGYANLGFLHPRLVKVTKEQLKKFSHIDYNIWQNSQAEVLAKKIIKTSNTRLDKVYFSGNSGSEAVEAAMKLSYQVQRDQGYKNKYIFISRVQSFHGSTLQAMSVSDIPIMDIYKKLTPFNIQKISQHNSFAKCKFDLKKNRCVCKKHYSNCMGKLKFESDENYTKRCVDELENKIKKIGAENICAFIGETQLGSLVGDVPPNKNYWKLIEKICKKNNIHIILDEVYNGFGRSGKLFNFEWDNFTPDFVCIGKNTTSGIAPLSAVITHSKFERIIKKGLGRIIGGHTFQGFSLGIAVCLESLKIYHEEKIFDKVNSESNYIINVLKNELKKLDTFANIKGRGFGISVEHNSKNNSKFSSYIFNTMFKKFKILVNSKFHRTSITPSLNMPRNKIDQFLDCFIKTFENASNKKI